MISNVEQTTNIVEVNLASIRLDGGTQVRLATDKGVVAEYVEAKKAGAKFPPPIVFFDGANYWPGDGHHRIECEIECARETGLNRMLCDVREGTRRDAILFAVGANQSHGLRRTRADKRNAVEILLRDPEWRMSLRWIANATGVSPDTVSRIDRELSESDSCEYSRSETSIGRDGKARRMPNPKDHAAAETAHPRLVDGLGNALPSALEPTWEARNKHWQSIDAHFSGIVDQLKALRQTPAGKRVRDTDLAEVRRIARNLRANIKPFVPCPEDGCRGDVGNESCERCKGTGWLPKSIYALTPSERKWPEPADATNEVVDD